MDKDTSRSWMSTDPLQIKWRPAQSLIEPPLYANTTTNNGHDGPDDASKVP
jgi:hypothetical protein